VIGAYLKTIVLAILVASAVLPTLVCAVDYFPGVKAGGWIKYGQISITWSGNGTEPSYITEGKKMDWVKMEVENVTGTTVSRNMTTHYNNGTQAPSISSSVDLNSNTGMSGILFIIAANLKSGDPLEANSPSNAPTINRTITGTYAGASRNINVLDVTTVSTSVLYGNQTSTFKFYWDQSTGFLVEMYTKQPDTSNSSTYTETSVKATETNMWSADFPGLLSNNVTYIIAGIIIIIAVIAAAIVLRKKNPPPSPPPRTSS
jgi:hypothetical protein